MLGRLQYTRSTALLLSGVMVVGVPTHVLCDAKPVLLCSPFNANVLTARHFPREARLT